MLTRRNIEPLLNFNPTTTDEELPAAALQFARKVSGFNKPSKANKTALLVAVDALAAVATSLLDSLETNAPPKNRAAETAKARARAERRFSG
jgi:hypothetical protein